MSKYTKNTLRKLEAVFEQLDYKVRYEKGNFKSGYCIVEEKKIAVINKFFDVQGRATTMIEILSRMKLDPEKFDDETAKLMRELIPLPAASTP